MTQHYFQLTQSHTSFSSTEQSEWLVFDASFFQGGVWSAATPLIEKVYLDLKYAGETTLLEEHNYALYMVLPEYRDEIQLQYACLTDSAAGQERTRNFPLDRAYRIIHGLVSLIKEWKSSIPADYHLNIVARRFDQSQHLSCNFLLELARRTAEVDIHVYVDSMPDEAIVLPVNHTTVNLAKRVMLPCDSVELTASAELIDEEQANALNAQINLCDEQFESRFLSLFAYYSSKNNTQELANLALHGVCFYNHYGYYYESGALVAFCTPYFNEIVGDDQTTRWNLVGNMFQGLVTTGKQQEALAIINTYAKPQLTDNELQAKMHYLLSMVYLRYLSDQDLTLAEQHIMAAKQHIAKAKNEIKDNDHAFLRVFIDNGLAFLRVRQQRKEEALSLCQEGYQFLTEKLGEDKHKLHRSVLLYNSAQVYMMMGRLEDALSFYGKAIEIDPYYSEYYNEVGNIYQRIGKPQEAENYYNQAIKYSAPYPEVYFNKGNNFSNLGMTDEAIACYSQSLELNPYQSETLLLRAELLEEKGDIDAALHDYNAALDIEPDSEIGLVNRASLLFEQGRFHDALTDMVNAAKVNNDPDYLENIQLIESKMKAEAV
ncbi:tetratricopeptide repeat protein [Aestuariibacter sp. AA17]|uniref:Tetratricopeptide repeat protein n=1 Tax=Fluctibacter corallii TaxID=2984329 RepID=A0ABT3A4P9_9ALTE|nr:tetratricopeptide repeat protein [Aestuariibacter sp. AA17]MCV2883609.1 tetratricopeptide repeat protein [Aestuariibacter sp. AA17]